ncbi:hypothetical protein KL918_004740 [Ogataea parapolymorpha]|nr:hypothetical protein KL918_004740 [Ogataea parapolymorpha]KAG7872743.1 hypothetical protein KL916_002788 [Ogataea parapolymorpha]
METQSLFVASQENEPDHQQAQRTQRERAHDLDAPGHNVPRSVLRLPQLRRNEVCYRVGHHEKRSSREFFRVASGRRGAQGKDNNVGGTIWPGHENTGKNARLVIVRHGDRKHAAQPRNRQTDTRNVDGLSAEDS